MPRNCGCAGGSCSCLIIAGPGLVVSGTGNSSDPYVVGLPAGSDDVIVLGPFTVAGTNVNLTTLVGELDEGVFQMNVEANVTLYFSDTAPVGARYEIRTSQSFGATIAFGGNVWTPTGTTEPMPAPASGVGWISAVKMSASDWFVRASGMVA